MMKILFFILMSLTGVTKAARIAVVESFFLEKPSDYQSSVVEKYDLTLSSSFYSSEVFDLQNLKRMERLQSMMNNLDDGLMLSNDDLKELEQSYQDKDFQKFSSSFTSKIHGLQTSTLAIEKSKNELILIKNDLSHSLYRSFNPREEKLIESISERGEGKMKQLVASRFDFLNEIGDVLEKSETQVVNFSWGINSSNLESILCGIINLKGRSCSQDDVLAKEFYRELKSFLRAFFERHHKIFFIIASGNDGHNLELFSSLFSFEKYNNVILVGALKSDHTRARFSNYGGPVEIFCPGVTLGSFNVQGLTFHFTGTSAAAPFAANRVGSLLDKGLLEKTEILLGLKEKAECL